MHQTKINFNAGEQKSEQKIQSRLIPKNVFAELPTTSSDGKPMELFELKLASSIRI